MDNLKSIGKNIARLRKAKGMTQEDLCGAVEMDRSYLSEIENGKENISVKTLSKIAKELGVTLSELVTMISKS